MNRKRTFLLTLAVILAAQININLLINNFKISIAIICLPVFLSLLEDVSLIPVTLFSALGVFFSRVLIYWFQHGEMLPAFSSYMPEICFYLTYGLLLYGYDRLARHHFSKNVFFISLVLTDYLANLTELLVRVGSRAFEPRTQVGILLVALLRTALVWCILTVFHRYRLTLLNREHAERYQRLMVLISRLNGEVIWMQKNTALIEETMNTSYRLYHRLKEADMPGDYSASALTVAKDIHEIKKEYFLIMRGLQEALHAEANEDKILVADLLSLLENAVVTEAKALGKQVSVTLECDNHLYTDQHYLLLSVFHNLFTNAMEASDGTTAHIRLKQTTSDSGYIFSVTDDGPGIDRDCAGQIFDPGFSTKINYDTGAVSRGLGLNIVKDIVEQQFEGQITLDSVPGRTTFTISIPSDKLEVK